MRGHAARGFWLGAGGDRLWRSGRNGSRHGWERQVEPKHRHCPAAGAVAVYGARRFEVTALPGWAADDVSEALPALLRSCDRLLAQPVDRPLKPVELGGTPGDWRAVSAARCAAWETEPARRKSARSSSARWFAVPLARPDEEAAGARPGEGSGWSRRIGLFTGYFRAPAPWQPPPERAVRRAAVHAALGPGHG